MYLTHNIGSASALPIIIPVDEHLREIKDSFLREFGEAKLHAKSCLCILELNCSEIFLKFCIFCDHFAQF